jgi:hypothetical protein
MTTAALPTRISASGFVGAIVGIWAVATGVVFFLAWSLRQLSIELGVGWFWLIIALFAFPLFYWLAAARWPSSSHVSRFGFALGSAATNCVLAIYAAWLVGHAIHGA